jgi:3'-5' exoribonuclease
VAWVCRDLARRYPQADADLLVTAALLHDIGTTEELVFDTTVGCTDVGLLLGHVTLGERMVSARAATLGTLLDHDTAARLSHAILAHHGEPERGSPVRPATLEALLLHHADLLGTTVATFSESVAGAALLEERWTDAANVFGRPLRVPGAVAGDRAGRRSACRPEDGCSTIERVPEAAAHTRADS